MTDQQSVLDAVLDNIGDAVVLTDGDRRPMRVNRAFVRMTGLDVESLIKAASPAAAATRDGLAAAFSVGGRWKGRLRTTDGRDCPVEATISPVSESMGRIDRLMAVIRPINVTTDGRFGVDELTGLPNRDIFLDRVEQSLLQAHRSRSSVALLVMGLDRFTLVNDALGHQAGDRLLVEVAQRLRQCVREADTAVRLDGDRFALVMTIAETDDSVIVAEKVLNRVRDPFVIDGQEVVATFSIGIGIFPQDAESGHGLIKQAENALHHAKVSGRNQYQFFSKDMNHRARLRLDLEARMRRALSAQEFRVFYQPKVSAETCRIVGAEALIRWMDPDLGMINPCDFIPVAEETGLIEPIGAWVLHDSCRQSKAWQDMGLPPVRVSVNVSPRQFRASSLLDMVVDVLRDTQLDPRWLELEITESMLMNDVELAVRKMAALRDLGIGLSIDDFGTGYSSLSYLGRFPITTLKIDRAFISDVDTNPKTAEIARAIIGLSRGLNLEVVAEGCEVVEHVRFLQDHGCSTVQGFYYSRPIPAPQFEELLAQGGVIRR